MENQQKQSIKREHARVTEYKHVFGSPQGKNVLFDLMARHFVLQPCFDPKNDSVTAHREGQRLVVNQILQILKVDPRKFQQLLEEAENAIKRNLQL